MSGFTTTGATIITNIEQLPRGILFWRSMTHWLGGMGIITLALAILPVFGIAAYQMFRGEVPGPTTEAFQEKARELGVVVVLNLFERDGETTYDCSPVIDADGTLLGRTRMVHITDYTCFHEQGYYAPGDTGAPVYQTRAGRIGVAICYDRHYPEYMRSLGVQGAELVVIPQAGSLDEWPEGMYEAEVRAAAFQNGYFAALCNRVGRE